MREEQQPDREGRLPGEVVETYRQPLPGEVVERYTRPLPGRGARPALSRPRRRTGVWIFAVCLTVVLGIAAGTGIWALLVRPAAPGDADGVEEMAAREEGVSIPAYPYGEGAALEIAEDRGQTLTAPEIYQRVNPAVVAVMAQAGEQASVGSGVIFRSDGYILTNYHILQGGEDCVAVLSTGWTYEARYVAGDAAHDLAVLKIDVTGLPTAEFGDSDRLSVGEEVYAIGNPMGMELRGTMTDGIVSALDRDVTVDGRVMSLIQTDAPLNTGNSGGPLIDRYGQVVGIVTLKIRPSYFSAEGLGFAIPSAAIGRLANDLLTYGEVRPEPAFGVTVLTPASWVEEGVRGLQVLEVEPGSAADRAGIREGDFVLAAGGTEVSSSQELLKIRRQLYVGDRITMTLWRDGERLEVTLELTEAAE